MVSCRTGIRARLDLLSAGQATEESISVFLVGCPKASAPLLLVTHRLSSCEFEVIARVLDLHHMYCLYSLQAFGSLCVLAFVVRPLP